MNEIDKIKNLIGRVDDLYENNDPFLNCSPKHFKEIEFFHPKNERLPNGSFIQRGGFLKECANNKNNFIINEALHTNQYGLKDYRGGVIVFSTDVNAVKLDDNEFINKLKQIILTFKQRYFKDTILSKALNKFNRYNPQKEYVGAYSVGNSFKGHYIGDNGEVYDENSISIEVNGLSSKALLYLAEYIARIFKQETVLVKDMNLNKIYLANGLRSNDEPDFNSINTKS